MGQWISFPGKKKKMFPKVSEEGRSQIILRRYMQMTQTETDYQIYRNNITLCILFSSNR